ncbi:MAG: L,D-transpeptidase [Acidithiobacillus sp.]
MVKIKGWWLGIVMMGLLGLAGCAPHLSAPPVHSVAYYASQIKAPVVAPVAPVVSPAVSASVASQPVRIVVSTEAHLLRIYKGDTLLATYPVAIGFNGSAPRRTRGDDVTPVGHYHIGWILHGTQYGPFMGLTYPNKENAQWGLKEGVISHGQYRAIVEAIDAGQTPPQNTPLGGEIGIHGMGPQFGDDPQSKVFPGRWTAGCVALSNWNAQQVAALVTVGTPVEIVGEVRGYRRNQDLEITSTKYRQRSVSRSLPAASDVNYQQRPSNPHVAHSDRASAKAMDTLVSSLERYSPH